MPKSFLNQEQAIEELVAELATEFIDDLEQGRKPDIDAIAAKHPDVSDIVRGTLSALQTMRTMSVDLMGTEPHAAKGSMNPKTLGDYRIIRELGRGGMGVVFEAEQISLHRRVALKILPYAAILDERALQRFKNEVIAAAQLDHPNIVPVHGVGCDRGVHHYAMRLVDGVTLALIIDELRKSRDRELPFPDSISSITAVNPAHPFGPDSGDDLETCNMPDPAPPTPETAVAQDTKRSRGPANWKNGGQTASHFRSIAELGATIAEALDHAHHHGIVHRDVKPSNILLDRTGRPWVADFGLAQVETGTPLTMTGDVLGTARYMSPEQLTAQRDILDHRTDIYSLGVTLYELLTLQLPFNPDNRQELFRQITNDEPKSPRQVNPSVPRNLATIVLKAIEKDPDDRYQSAQNFAEDLIRFAKDKSIVACRPHLLKRTGKWVSRHFALAGVIFLALVFFSIAFATITVIQNIEKTKTKTANLALDSANQRLNQRNEELEEAKLGLIASNREAQRERDVAVAISNFLTDDLLRSGSPMTEPDRDIKLRAVIDAASRQLEFRFSDQPVVKASLHHLLGEVYLDLAEFEAAEIHLLRAIGIQDQVLGSLDPGTLRSRHNLAVVYLNLYRLDEAEILLDDVLAKCKLELGSECRETQAVLACLASLYSARGQHQQSQVLLRKVVKTCHDCFGADDSATMDSELQLGKELTALGLFDESRQVIARSLEAMRRTYGDQHPSTLKAKNLLAFALIELGLPEEAVDILKGALADAKSVLGERHADTVDMMSTLGGALQDAGRLDDAERMLRDALTVSDGEPDWSREEVWKSANNLGLLLIMQGNPVEAEKWLRKSLGARKLGNGDGHVNTIINGINLFVALRDQGKLDEAVLVGQETVESADSSLGPTHHNTVIARHLLGHAFWLGNRFDEAVEVYREQLGALSRERAPNDPDAEEARFNLAINLKESGHLEEAASHFEHLYRLRDPLSPPHMSSIVGSLLEIYKLTGKRDQAAKLISESIETARTKMEANGTQFAGILAMGSVELLEVEAFAKAETALRECLKIREIKLPDDWLLFNTKSMLGYSLTEQGNYEAAEPLVIGGYLGMKAREELIPDDAKMRLDEAHQRIITLFSRWNRPDEVERWRSGKD